MTNTLKTAVEDALEGWFGKGLVPFSAPAYITAALTRRGVVVANKTSSEFVKCKLCRIQGCEEMQHCCLGPAPETAPASPRSNAEAAASKALHNATRTLIRDIDARLHDITNDPTISNAVKQTHADKLAEALEDILFEDSDKSDQDRIITRLRAQLALEKFKEIANGI